MSIQLKISAQEEKNSFIINDCTGDYSIDNKGGYGIPNARIEDVTESFFEIQSPSDIEPYPHMVNVFPDFPNHQDNGYEILPFMVGQSNNEIESGEWKIKHTQKYLIKGKEITKTAFLVVIFTKSIECCIDKHTAGKLTANAFKDEKQKLIIELSNLLENVFDQIKCGLFGKANETIEYLKSQCKCCGC